MRELMTLDLRDCAVVTKAGSDYPLVIFCGNNALDNAAQWARDEQARRKQIGQDFDYEVCHFYGIAVSSNAGPEA